MAINFPSNPSVNDTFTVDDKTFLWTGEYWRTLSSAVTFPGIIKDADNDTRVEVEQSADEDTIRFNVAGSEKGYFDSSGLTVSDSATANFFVSSGSGANLMPSGTTAERPASPTAGMFRFNETTGEPEYYSGVAGNWLKFREAPLLSMSYLVIAGGGSGGYRRGGGGGAGGYRNSYASESSGGGASTESTLSLEFNTSYTVTVGAGGTGISSFTISGNQGNPSTFATITSVGGGGGGSDNGGGAANSGDNGGSGGGAGATDSVQAYGNGTSGQGYRGGANGTGHPYPPGGGGGAGAVGGNGSGSSAGAGGVGVASSITGSSIYRGGGGGGGATVEGGSAGAGGTGGGGAGASSGGTSGTANTGGGGGGNAGSGTTGAGGSGVVILRYPNSFTATVSAGLTSTTTTVGSDKVTVFTAGTGTVSWA